MNRRGFFLAAASTLALAPVADAQVFWKFGPNYYANSVSGNDSNNGSSPALAFASLAAPNAAIVANPTKNSLDLALASFWRDQLGKTVLPTNTSISTYGAGGVPIITGTNSVSVWTADGTNANVWDATVTIDDETGSGNRLRVYQPGVNGALLTRVADAATCSTTPGSFVDQHGGAGPWLVQIHTSDGSDPNGHAYEVTVRHNAIAMGDGCQIVGPIQCQRALDNNGAIDVGLNMQLTQLLSVDGSKHNMLFGSGQALDCIACRIDAPTSYEVSSTFLVGFTPNAAGHTLNLTRVGLVSDSGTTVSPATAFISHDLFGGSYDSYVGIQCWTSYTGSFQVNAKIVQQSAFYNHGGFQPLSTFADSAEFDYLQLTNNNTSGLNVDLNGLGGAISKHIIFRNSVFYDLGSNRGWFFLGAVVNGYTIEFNNCIFYSSGFRNHIDFNDWSSGALIVNNCIFSYAANGNPIRVPTGVTYQGNNNVFLCSSNALTALNCYYHGTNYTTLLGWRGATGQDANSLVFGPSSLAALFSGTVANGDLRLGGSGAGAQAAALLAGPQNHWDWNARAAASGPPSRWPVVPDTLADSQAYIANPAGWSW